MKFNGYNSHYHMSKGFMCFCRDSSTVTITVSSESQCSFTDRGKALIQKKPTMYPAWKSTFDAHIYEGRVIEVALMKNSEESIAGTTVGVSDLAKRCKSARPPGQISFCLDLQPSGKVFLNVQIFLEDSDAGDISTFKDAKV